MAATRPIRRRRLLLWACLTIAALTIPLLLYGTRTEPAERPSAAERFVAGVVVRLGLRPDWALELWLREQLFRTNERMREGIPDPKQF